MAVLVTGATGFIGLNIVHALIAADQDVVMFAPSLPPPLAGLDWVRRACFVAGDVRSAADAARAFAVAPISHVVHAAAVTPDADTEVQDPSAIASVNLEGTMRIVQAAAAAGVSRALMVSSVAVYGNPISEAPLDEATSRPCPTSLYGITKLAAERSALRLGDLLGLDVVVVRLGPCFGAREHPSGVRALLSPHWQVVEAALAGEACVLPRAMAADWTDAVEVGRAIAALLAARPLAHRVFHVGGGAISTVASWCDAVGRLLPGLRWRVDPADATVRIALAQDRPGLATRRLEQAIGWCPDSRDLAAKAAAYLAWRLGPEGRALIGPPAGDPMENRE